MTPYPIYRTARPSDVGAPIQPMSKDDLAFARRNEPPRKSWVQRIFGR